jgi:hypothetical protein
LHSCSKLHGGEQAHAAAVRDPQPRTDAKLIEPKQDCV